MKWENLFSGANWLVSGRLSPQRFEGLKTFNLAESFLVVRPWQVNLLESLSPKLNCKPYLEVQDT